MDLPFGFDEEIFTGFSSDTAPAADLAPAARQARKEPRVSKNQKYLPPSHLRKLVKTSTTQPSKEVARMFVQNMRYVPLAIFKLLENIPMPWEATKPVNVIYHVSGVLTFIDDVPKVAEPVYVAQWASMWQAMRSHKLDIQEAGGHFRRVSFPLFSDDTEFLDYEDYQLDRAPEPLTNDLIDEDGDDKAVSKWFYATEAIARAQDHAAESLAAVDGPLAFNGDDVPRLESPNCLNYYNSRNGLSANNSKKSRGGQYYFTVDVINNLFRFAHAIINRHNMGPEWCYSADRNGYFLWDLQSFYNAKALGLAIPRAPRFDNSNTEINEDDWTQYTRQDTVIFREDPHRPAQNLITERHLQFPFLYASGSLRNVRPAPYHTHARTFILPQDDAEAFESDLRLSLIKPLPLDPIVTEIRNSKLRKDNETPILPINFAPFLSEYSLDCGDGEGVKDAMRVAASPSPFNTFTGGMRRRIDIALASDWSTDPLSVMPSDDAPKTKLSCTKLLKLRVGRRLKSRKKLRMRLKRGLSAAALRRLRPPSRLQSFGESAFFRRTTIDWLEAGLQLVRQGHMMLQQFLKFKGLPYIHVNYNFVAQPTRHLTTKERKKSRFGPAFHLLREFLKFTKYVLDLYVSYRRKMIDAYQLADGLNYFFNHVGTLTEIYRYKYRVHKQERECRDIKHLLYSRFNVGEVEKGPGNGFWAPSWRVWIFFMKGMTPLVGRMLHNLAARMLRGRENREIVHRVTKQRIDSDFDVNIKDRFRKEVMDILPLGANERDVRKLDQYLNDSFRHWKRHTPWHPAALPRSLLTVIEKYVTLRADNYRRIAELNRRRIMTGDAVDKTLFKKNLGQLTRLKLMGEIDRQAEHVQKGPAFDAQTAAIVVELVGEWLRDRKFTKIPFPRQGHPQEMELLKLSTNTLRGQHNVGYRLTQAQREEQARIEKALDNPHETLQKIRENLTNYRLFNRIKISYMDTFDELYPVYEVAPAEKMIDAFLDQYLWLEASERHLFPNWAKPSDDEPVPVLLHKWCTGMSRMPNMWDTSNGESVIIVQMALEEQLYDNVDWVIFRPILEFIMDKTLVDYIVAHHNVLVEYKDMSYNHSKGILRGLMFSGFLSQVWGLVVDLLLLGIKQATRLAGAPERPNRFLEFRTLGEATAHPIRGYLRYNDEIRIVMRLSRSEADDLVRSFSEDMEAIGEAGVLFTTQGFRNKRCWPPESRMVLNLTDTNLARAALHHFVGRVPAAFGDVRPEAAFVSVYSTENSNLLFDLGGFEVRLLPTVRAVAAAESQAMWTLRDPSTREHVARAYLMVTRQHVLKIRNRIRQAIMSVGNSAFYAIAAKWNAVLTEVIPYYREAILGTAGLQEIFVKGEHKLQKRVMMALNTKMAQRFPPVIFYAPQESIGGLGMLSVAQSLIPADDRLHGLGDTILAFRTGLTNIEDKQIPNVLNYYTSWEAEIEDSERAWRRYWELESNARRQGLRVSPADLEDLKDRGIPRIRTVLGFEDARVYRHDHGFRVRLEFLRYVAGKKPRESWFSRAHDGAIGGNLKQYRLDVNEALGGVDAILEHTLFYATGLTSWETLAWAEGGFEKSKQDAKLTKAQRGGLTTVPNRRFALWWSPTINRSKVLNGFESQIERTGVFIYGKLDVIKAALIQLFLPDRWEKVHIAIVRDIAVRLHEERCMTSLGATAVREENIHPHKSFVFTTSTADITLTANGVWRVSGPSYVSDAPQLDTFNGRPVGALWIDVQLRWGNYDAHNIALYAQQRFDRYTNDGVSPYPSPAGIVVAFDLAYNCYSAYGYWVPGLKAALGDALRAIARHNPQMTAFRDRLKNALQLQAREQPREIEDDLTVLVAEDERENATTWLVDGSQTRCKGENGAVSILDPRTGALYFSVVSRSFYAGQKRAKRLAVQKTCEEINTWVHSIPAEERPRLIVVTQRQLTKAVAQAVPISVTATDMHLPLSQLLRHSRLGSMRSSATASRKHKFCVYDDWMSFFSASTCFRMLLTILRAYFYDIDRARQILIPDAQITVRPGHFWPTYTQSEWIERLRELHDMIIACVCVRLRIQPKDLTERDRESIILGRKFVNEGDEAEDLEAVQEARKRAREAAAAGERASEVGERRMIDTVDPLTGEKIRREVVVRRESRIDRSGAAEWRTGVVEAIASRNAIRHLLSQHPVQGPGMFQISLPRTGLQRLLFATDPRRSMVAFLFGFTSGEVAAAANASVFLVPLQRGGVDVVATVNYIPFTTSLLTPPTDIRFLGILRAQHAESVPNSADLELVSRVSAQFSLHLEGGTDADAVSDEGTLTALSSVVDTYDEYKNPLQIVLVSVGKEDTVIRSFSVLKAGMVRARALYERRVNAGSRTVSSVLQEEPAQLMAEEVVEAAAVISGRLHGCLLAPSFNGGAWNLQNLGEQWLSAQDLRYKVEICSTLEPSYGSKHRTRHFREFVREIGAFGVNPLSDAEEADEEQLVFD